jgi:hypothetical protein
MCMRIKSDQEQNERDLYEFINGRKEIFVYKILQNGSFYTSLYHPEFIWNFSKQKIYEVDRPPKPTNKESKDTYVSLGLHVYTSLEEAKYRIRTGFYDHFTIVKFKVRAEDIIAVENGWTCNSTNFLEAVCTRLEFVEIVG